MAPGATPRLRSELERSARRGLSAATAPRSRFSSSAGTRRRRPSRNASRAEGLKPVAVADALAAIARAEDTAFAEARLGVLRSFEERDAFLEDVRVADTVLVLDVLARARRMETPRVDSPLLPRS
jgi:hypothetical protein